MNANFAIVKRGVCLVRRKPIIAIVLAYLWEAQDRRVPTLPLRLGHERFTNLVVRD